MEGILGCETQHDDGLDMVIGLVLFSEGRMLDGDGDAMWWLVM